MGDRWQGIAAIEGEPTGDSRVLDPGSIRWENGPWPLIWDIDGGGHEAPVIGFVDEFWREGDFIMASGELSDSENEDVQALVQRARELLIEGAVGVSLRLDSEESEIRVDPALIQEEEMPADEAPPVEDDEEETAADGRVVVARMSSDDVLYATTSARARHLAIVDTAAFAEARIQLEGDEAGPSDEDDEEQEDLDGFVARLTADFAAAGADLSTFEFPCPKPFGSFDECVERMSQEDSIDDPEAFCAAWERACEAQAASLTTPTSETQIALVSSLDMSAFSNPNFGADADEDPRLVRQEPERPEEKVTFGCPLTITEDGRVFGHAALWGRCHASFGTRCVPTPRGGSYNRFLSGAAVPGLATGPLTVGTTHADLHAGADEAMHHYSDSGRQIADVVVGEDHLGIWVSGRLRPGVTDDEVAQLRGSALSGDWRPVGNQLRLTGLLAVSNPGFLVQRQVDEPLAASLITIGATCQDCRESLVAAAGDTFDGAVISLKMPQATAERLAVEGYETAEQLHLTLAWLGEAADYSDDARQQILATVEQAFADEPAIRADAFAFAVFNPEVYDNGKPEADVLLVNSQRLAELRRQFEELDRSDHGTWIPHVTLGYSMQEDVSATGWADRFGQVEFDRVEVAFGEDRYDFALKDNPDDEDDEDPRLASLYGELAETRDRLRLLESLFGDQLVREFSTDTGPGA